VNFFAGVSQDIKTPIIMSISWRRLH